MEKFPLQSEQEIVPKGQEKKYAGWAELSKTLEKRLGDILETDAELKEIMNESGSLKNDSSVTETIANIKDVSRATRMLFESFIPRANNESRRPKKLYQQESDLDFVLHRTETHFDTTRDTHAEVRRSSHERDGVTINQTLVERDFFNQRTQRLSLSYDLGPAQLSEVLDGETYVEEWGKEGEIKKELGYFVRVLQLALTGEGGTIDFDTLLPAGAEFLPAAFDDTSGGLGGISLDKYVERTNGDRDWKCQTIEGGSGGTVVYGDLSEAGSRLSLLHEIAHSWQHAYGIVKAKSRYRNALGKAAGDDFGNQCRERYMKPGEERLDQEEIKRRVAADFREFLVARSGEVWQQIISYNAEAVGEIYARVIVLGDAAFSSEEEAEQAAAATVIHIDTEALMPFFQDYVLEERDAWAHAIRVMRFLRSRGIDIEPDVQSLHDLQQLIYGDGEALASYEHEADMLPEIFSGRFVRPITSQREKSGNKTEFPN